MGYLDGDPYSAADYAEESAMFDRWSDVVSKLGPYAQTSQRIISDVRALACAQGPEPRTYENSYHEAIAARIDYMHEQYGRPNHDLRY